MRWRRTPSFRAASASVNGFFRSSSWTANGFWLPQACSFTRARSLSVKGTSSIAKIHSIDGLKSGVKSSLPTASYRALNSALSKNFLVRRRAPGTGGTSSCTCFSMKSGKKREASLAVMPENRHTDSVRCEGVIDFAAISGPVNGYRGRSCSREKSKLRLREIIQLCRAVRHPLFDLHLPEKVVLLFQCRMHQRPHFG